MRNRSRSPKEQNNPDERSLSSQSIRLRLSLLLFVATAGIAFAVGELTLNAARNLFFKQAHAQLTNYNQALASEINTITDKAGNSLLMARHDAAIDRYFNAQVSQNSRATALTEIQDRLLYLNKTFAIDEICLISTTGAELVRVSGAKLATPDHLSPNETGNPFFTDTLRLDSEAVYRSVVPYRSVDTHVLAIAHATPIILGDGRRAGILHFEIPLQWFEEKMQTIVPEGGASFLIAEDGSMLVTPPKGSMTFPAPVTIDNEGNTKFAIATEVGTESFQRLADRILKTHSGTGQYFDGHEMHEVVYRPALNGHWIVATSLPYARILAPYNSLFQTTVLVATPIAALALLIMLLYTNRMVRPLRQLTSAMRKLAQGDLTPDIVADRRDELGEMAQAFNAMVQFQRAMAAKANDIATGNLQTNFHPASTSDVLGHALLRMIASLTTMLGDIQRAEARFRSLIHNIRDVIFILDRNGVVQYVNPAIGSITGRTTEQVVGHALSELVDPEDHGRLSHVLDESIGGKHAATTELRLRQDKGAWSICEFVAENLLNEPSVTGIIATCHDITERKEYEQRLSHQALHDGLTSLANRALFQDRLQLAVNRRKRRKVLVGVVLIDLDNFKTINDSLGHKYGDAMLLVAAQRIRESVRNTDTVARLGGDEFAVLLDDCGTMESGIEVVERILANMRIPAELEGREIYLGCSIGIAFSRLNGERAEDLLANADMAMYKAKNKGKGQFAVFDEVLGKKAVQRLEIESAMRHAIQRKEFVVYYQPIVELESERITEVEALIRWNHPEQGQISPATFIPIAEDSGLILAIGNWVLQQACQDVQLWNQRLELPKPIIVNVNLSTKQFQSPTLIEDVVKVLEETGLPAECLKLEITESVMMYDTQTTVAILWRLKELGVKLAIDDFGTGYSSLSYLKSLPIDLLKIDRSFVRGLGSNAEDNAIVRAIIGMARSLGIRVTAEGIETREQVGELKSLNCEQGQGYLYARPGPATDIESLLIKAHDRNASMRWYATG